ncbi:ABC transporter substrate-binding protein [Protaetiibacter sp. SSC-01]|uniref:peptide ABC transporter substrate-binding protein n=1 Tax=Protaetiibacter sp. SSC-01 TaxID=2759943 RepID=UPI001656E7E2|nr:ABC transporter substrate-binding protein [Protaetiibacter sp. SSC-01]QNO36799.1 ABC transporter substrate-binding protein [Protaetiibacter sp. SSC-01]
MRISRIAAAAGGVAVAAALVLSGCSSDNGGNGGGSASSGVVNVAWSEPENPLIPANTNEVNGGQVLNNMFAGLVYYKADGSWDYDAAESIESEDYKTWTVTLKADQKFSDGTPVTSESFVNAWQWAAADPELLNQWWFIDAIAFEGGTYDGGEDTLALEVIDDTTFTVELAEPRADFPVALGYTVFFPLPEAFFEDPEAFGDAPIGNGPYKLGEDGWVHGESLSLVPNENYNGPRKAANGGLNFKVYATLDAAYADLLSDNVDIVDSVPTSALATFKDDLGDRAVEQASAVFQSFTIQPTLEGFAYDEEGKLRRAAISHAINRAEITEVIFQGTRTPAEDFTSPVIAGFDPEAVEGSEVMEYDPELAKELWAQADAIRPWTGTFQLAYNADGGHQEWVDATVNSIKNALGIDAVGLPYPDFAGLRTEVNDRTIKSAFRTGWQFDFPSAANILGALYVTGSGSNDADYSNPEFDELFRAGLAAVDQEEQADLFNQSQKFLFEDLPAIPLWYGSVTAGYSTLVDDVEFGWDSWPLLYAITKG